MAHGGDTHVVTLKGKEQFNEFIKQNKYVLVDFSTEWCHWCKVLAPEYKAAADVFHQEQINNKTSTTTTTITRLVYVDGDVEENSELLTKYKVEGFPTLYYFQNGNLDDPQEFSGDRNKEGIVSWCQKRAMPAVQRLNSFQDFTKFKESNTKGRNIALVVWLKGEPTTNKTLEVIYGLADGHRDDFSVGHITDDAVAKECSLTSPFTIFRSFDEPVATLTPSNIENLNAEEMLNLIKGEKMPLLGEIIRENASDYLSNGLPLVWIAGKFGTSDENENQGDEKEIDVKQGLIDALKPLAKEYKGQLLFVLLNANLFSSQPESLGMTNLPGIMIQKAADKYLYRGNWQDANALSEFFRAWKDGKLPKFLKSQEVPTTQDPEGPYVLVSSTFEDHVGTIEKDAFVDFYADWCAPCQRLAPTYKEVAKAFKGVKGLLIAKINADKNDTFQKIQSYPTLLFFKKGSRDPIKYEGDRSFNSFVEFIKANSTADCSSVSVQKPAEGSQS